MDKKWFESKAIWSGILVIALSLYQMVTTGNVRPDQLTDLFMGSGLIGVRQALK